MKVIKHLSPSLVVLSTIVALSPATHAAETSGSSLAENESTWSRIRQRTRLNTFSELSGPALAGNPASVPDASGAQLDPINLFNSFTLEYDIGENTRMIWFQRLPVNLSSNTLNQGIDGTFSDPRFGLRRVNLIDIKGLTTSLDLFVHPGTSEKAGLLNRWAEFGGRATATYSPSGQRWTLGAVADARAGLFRGASARSASDVLGLGIAWASYRVNDKVSTQHWGIGTLQSQRGNSKVTWDYPGEPYIQNGVGYQLTSRIWTAVLINNYLMTAPTLRNTWVSSWISLNIL